MLEIVALYFLCKDIGKVAARKGQSPRRWKLIVILSWFATEFTGLLLGLMLFGKDNLIGLALFALMCAIGSYLYVKAQIDKMPDIMDKPE